MATTTRINAIGLWLDKTSDATNPTWIVSRDFMNSRYESETTYTIGQWPIDDYDRAKEFALRTAREIGLCVIEIDDSRECVSAPRRIIIHAGINHRIEIDGSRECVFAPRRIIIHDGINHCRAEYRLFGRTLEMIQAGGCDDTLNNNGCDVNDMMDDDAIVEAVHKSWTGEEYDGAPDENDLTISVETEKAIIER